jgi:hypothetical protein
LNTTRNDQNNKKKKKKNNESFVQRNVDLQEYLEARSQISISGRGLNSSRKTPS